MPRARPDGIASASSLYARLRGEVSGVSAKESVPGAGGNDASLRARNGMHRPFFPGLAACPSGSPKQELQSVPPWNVAPTPARPMLLLTGTPTSAPRIFVRRTSANTEVLTSSLAGRPANRSPPGENGLEMLTTVISYRRLYG